MPAVPRLMSIVYGGATVGGASSTYLLHGEPPIGVRVIGGNLEVRATILVRATGASETAALTQLASDVSALQAAARKINVDDLAVNLGSGDIFAGSHAANTAMLTRASVSKNPAWSAGASQLWDLTITARLPADATGYKNGLVEADVDLSAPFANGRRTLTITGSYTALPGDPVKPATEVHDDDIDTLAAIYTDAAGGTWVLDQHGRTPDDEDKVATFSRNYLEVEDDGLMEYVPQETDLPSGQKELTISGRYAAITVFGARVAYEAGIEARVQATLASVTGTFNLMGISLTPDDQDRRISFSHRFREVLKKEYGASSGLDNPNIVHPTIQINVSEPAPGDAEGARRPAVVSALFSCTVRREVTDLRAFYESTIHEPLLADIRTESGASTLALVRKTVIPSEEDRRLVAALECLAVVGSEILERKIETTDVELYPFQLWPVWNGNAFARAKEEGIGQRFREVRDTRVRLGSHPLIARQGGGGSGGSGARPGGARVQTISREDLENDAEPPASPDAECRSPGPNWHEVKDIRSAEIDRYGLPGTSFVATRLVTVCEFEYGELVAAGGGGGGEETPGEGVGEPIYRDSPDEGRPVTGSF